MNNEMDDFSVAPGEANYFGLLGNEANKIEPFKRPLSSMTPTIVFKDEKPFFNWRSRRFKNHYSSIASNSKFLNTVYRLKKV